MLYQNYKTNIPKKMNDINKDIIILLLKKMIEIRRFEEKSIQLYQKNKLYGQLHPYL